MTWRDFLCLGYTPLCTRSIHLKVPRKSTVVQRKNAHDLVNDFHIGMETPEINVGYVVPTPRFRERRPRETVVSRSEGKAHGTYTVAAVEVGCSTIKKLP